MSTDGLERIIRFMPDWMPDWDRRHVEPVRKYGMHSVDLLFVLKGPLGAVHFNVYTNWHLPHVQKEWDQRPGHIDCRPLPADVGYHSPTPHRRDQSICSDACEWLDGRPCYADGSELLVDDIFAGLVRRGDTAVWDELEKIYQRWIVEEEHDGSD